MEGTGRHALLTISASQLHGGHVQYGVSNRDASVLQGVGSPQHGPDPCHQLSGRKRFDQIVIRACVQTLNAVIHR